MTIEDMLAFAAGTPSKGGSSSDGYYINFYFKDSEGTTRRETLFDGLTSKEADDIVRGMKESQRKLVSILETYEDRLYR